MTLEQLGDSMSSAEFSMWLALYKVSPWDERRIDIGFGQVAAAIANYAGKMRKESAENATPLDFMLFEDQANMSQKNHEKTDQMDFFKALK